MEPITTWYKQKLKYSSFYEYSHFTLGHSDLSSPPNHDGKWSKCHCFLDITKSPVKVID